MWGWQWRQKHQERILLEHVAVSAFASAEETFLEQKARIGPMTHAARVEYIREHFTHARDTTDVSIILDAMTSIFGPPSTISAQTRRIDPSPLPHTPSTNLQAPQPHPPPLD